MKKTFLPILMIMALSGCEDVKNTATDLVKDTVKETVEQVKGDFVAELENFGVSQEQIEIAQQRVSETKAIIQEIQNADLSNNEIANSLATKFQGSYACLKQVAPQTVDSIMSGIVSNALEANVESFIQKNIDQVNEINLECFPVVN